MPGHFGCGKGVDGEDTLLISGFRHSLSYTVSPPVPSLRVYFFHCQLTATPSCSCQSPPLPLPGVHTSSPLHSPSLASSTLLCASCNLSQSLGALTCSLSQHQLASPFQPLITGEEQCSPGQPLQLEPAAEPGIWRERHQREGRLQGCLVDSQHQHSANVLGERHLEVFFLGRAV